jgi:hypothetical protein
MCPGKLQVTLITLLLSWRTPRGSSGVVNSRSAYSSSELRSGSTKAAKGEFNELAGAAICSDCAEAWSIGPFDHICRI